jgi:hypothetical protein
LNFEERSKFKINFNILHVELDDLTINFTWWGWAGTNSHQHTMRDEW